jgi:hypothetical protein
VPEHVMVGGAPQLAPNNVRDDTETDSAGPHFGGNPED